MDVSDSDLLHIRLCNKNELENGQMKEYEINRSIINTTVLLIRQNNQFYAYASKCCHYKLPLVKGVLVNNRLRCFAHGACFRVDTGDIEDHPGHGNLPKFNIEIINNQVILVATKRELQMFERIKTPENLEIDSKPTTVIVGGGAGGFTCADMLRQNGFRGRIIIFERERMLPYDRVQLSKQPSKNFKELLLRDKSYYDKYKIDLILGTEVTNISWEPKILSYKILGNRINSMEYDYLVLATGLRSTKLPSTIPGSNYRNILYLRSLDDATYFVHIVNLGTTQNIVIIGDSFIALEVCGWLTTGLSEKKNVSVIMRSCTPMRRIFGERIGNALQKVHERNGAKFYANATITEITGDNETVKFVQLITGESIPCDLVLVAIGSELCSELYKDSPIVTTYDGFIRVNERLETSVSHVLAVGDICKYPLRAFHLEDINCQHWQMACSTGHQAAHTILYHYLRESRFLSRSLKLDFYTIPIFWTTQNNKTTIRYVGYTRNPDNVIIHGDLENEFKFVAYYIVNNVVRAVAQSKFDPLTSEIAEIFHSKRYIRKEDIENDVYGYKQYL